MIDSWKNWAKSLQKTIPNPAKANGTQWTDHKYRGMKKVLEKYLVYMAHLESSDSQSHERLEIQGNIKTWLDPLFPLYLALYLDILAPICHISRAKQQDIHDPVEVIKRTKEFT